MNASVKIVPYEPGAARVYHRQTGADLGYVLQNFHENWTPYCDGRPVGAAVGYRIEAAEALYALNQFSSVSSPLADSIEYGEKWVTVVRSDGRVHVLGRDAVEARRPFSDEERST